MPKSSRAGAIQEAFQSFADETIGPITQQEGLPAPLVTFVEVHNYLTAG